jgi:hypothetical protein
MGQHGPDSFPPQGVDLSTPSVARMYDYYLGGDANWAIDRELADRILADFPQVAAMAKANRQFLFRVVRHLMRRGVRQFVDLGAGIPTMDHVHSVADAFEPGTARVVYVDNEPVAVAHSQLLLERDGDRARHTAINADIRAPQRLWAELERTGLIDFGQPLALLLIAVLHMKQPDEHGDDMGERLVAEYRDLLPSGSYLAISHGTNDGVPARFTARIAEAKALYDNASNPMVLRDRRQIAALFGDFVLLEPGMSWTSAWHPEEAGPTGDDLALADPSEAAFYAGVGRKTAENT